LLVIVAGCTSTVHPPGASRDSKVEVVTSIKLVGAKSVSHKKLLDGLAMRPPQRSFWVSVEKTYFDPLTHRLDIKRIVAFYREQGFLSAKVVKAEVLKKGRTNRHLVYYIEEGTRTKISRIKIALAQGSKLQPGTLAGLLTVKEGSDFNYELYNLGLDELQRSLIKDGYAFAQVTGTIEVQPGKNAAELHYRVVEGLLARFGPLTIVGNNRIPDAEILRRITFREGDPFDWVRLERSRAELHSMGVFATVEFDHEKSETEVSTPMVLRVKEAARYELKLGGGAGADRINYNLRARGSFRVSSFLLPLGQLRLEATPRLTYSRGLNDLNTFTENVAPAFEASSSYNLQSILSTKFDFSSKLAYAIDNFTGYSIKGPRASLGLTRSLLVRRLQLGLSYRFRLQDPFDVDPSLSNEDKAAVGLNDSYRLGALVQRISYDKRDNPIQPTRGWVLSFEAEEAFGAIGSEFAYIRGGPDARVYFPLTSRTILAGRARYSSSLLFGDVLPITQRYFGGGSGSQRGFDQRTLSPVLGGVAVGGESIVETNMEIRQRLGGSDFGVVAFLDGADVVLDAEDLFADGLHWAAGLGLRYQTFIGTVRADAGYRLNRKGPTDEAPDSNWAGFINLGEAF
jgi:outer membrane protein assembly factor BamA